MIRHIAGRTALNYFSRYDGSARVFRKGTGSGERWKFLVGYLKLNVKLHELCMKKEKGCSYASIQVGILKMSKVVSR